MVKPLAKAPANKSTDYSTYEEGQHWTSDPAGIAEIRFSKTGKASEKVTPASTLIDVFNLAVKKKGSKIALRTEGMKALKKGESVPPAKPLDLWKSWTWKQYLSDVRNAAKALISMGMEQHDSVNVFGFNSPEWFIGQMSAMFAGGKVAGIYPSDNAEQVQFKSNHSNAAVAYVETKECLEKFTAVIDDLPYLKAIVCWATPEGDDIKRSDGTVVKTMSFQNFLKEGEKVDDEVLDERIKLIKPGHCAALIYTSGTTGRPKAVMISHDNLAFESNTVLPLTGVGKVAVEERVLSYLPLSHVAGLMVDCIAPVVVAAYQPGWISVNFARVYDLKAGTIGQRLTSVQPTLFLGVPRVWEKIQEKLLAVGAATKGLKKKLSTIAKKKGLQHQLEMQLGKSGKQPFMFGPYKILLKVIKTKLGLNQCKFAFAGAAPMTRECLTYFGSLGINVNEAYGMSECTGATTMSTDLAHQWGTVGFEIPGTEVKCFKVAEDGTRTECALAKDILHPTEDEQGEICFRGRHIMMGYMANPKLGDEHVEEIDGKNAGAIDKDGWLHSGDKGAISKAGMVRITGRYKELIIGAGGENIAPVPIEDNIKKLCPYVSNVMMVGDKRKFNVMLLTLKCDGATGELPGSDELIAPAKAYGKTIKEACSNKKMIADITKAITDTNKDGEVVPSNAAKVQKFTILPIDFSVATDELTATLKLKRSVVNDKYIDLIDAMYESKDTFVPCTVSVSYDIEEQKDPMPRGSFKATEPLDMVDDDGAKTVEKAVAASEEETPVSATA